MGHLVKGTLYFQSFFKTFSCMERCQLLEFHLGLFTEPLFNLKLIHPISHLLLYAHDYQ